jgi:hypothetical protein
MRVLRITFIVLIAGTFLLAGYLTLSSLGLLGGPALAEVKPVPAGHQEIAWIAPATGGDAWERLVAALEKLEREWPEAYPDSPRLKVSLQKAFMPLTAGVAEIALALEGNEDAELWIRWYKLSSEISVREWIDKLSRRRPAPLAVIGGDNSDRALTLAQALRDQQDNWQGKPPVFLITTATADRYFPGDPQYADLTLEIWPKLMDVYKGRSFRFSFTNTHMAQAVVDFVKQHPDVWMQVNSDPAALAGIAASGDAWHSLARLAAFGHFRSPFMNTLAWRDDRYSLDLAERFTRVFRDTFYPGRPAGEVLRIRSNYINYSVGDYSQPNPREGLMVGVFLADYAFFREDRHLLVLPTGTHRARRFLRTVARQAPMDIRNLVVLSGDSITFNNIYRDRDIAWNVQDLPVPLVFFSHRNPIDPAAGFGQRTEHSSGTTGTQDLLLYRDIAESVVEAVFQQRQLVADSDVLVERLWQTQWCRGRVRNPHFCVPPPNARPLFDAEGNRHAGTGEFVVWLKPRLENGRTLAEATITVWSLRPRGDEQIWRPFGPPLHVSYDRSFVGD